MRLNGHYLDGKTSQRHPVEVMPTVAALHIYGIDGALVGKWSYQGLKLVDEGLKGQVVRFRHGEMGGALLTVDSDEILDHIETAAGVRFRQTSAIRPTRTMLIFSAGILTVLIFVLWWGFPRLAAPLVRLIPFAWEKELGEGVVDHLRKGKPFCANRDGAAALGQMAGELIAAAGSPFPITVRVIPAKMVNAFAAPGGQVVLFSGLIEKAESPEEVAGVMAHEIAHATERHPMQSMLRAAGVSLLFGLVVGDTSTLGSMASEGAELLLVLSYSRETEREADRIGMELLNRAGIRGDGLVNFFGRLQEESGGKNRVPVLFASHPMHAERIERLKLLATGTQAALSQTQWQALRHICQ